MFPCAAPTCLETLELVNQRENEPEDFSLLSWGEGCVPFGPHFCFCCWGSSVPPSPQVPSAASQAQRAVEQLLLARTEMWAVLFPKHIRTLEQPGCLMGLKAADLFSGLWARQAKRGKGLSSSWALAPQLCLASSCPGVPHLLVFQKGSEQAGGHPKPGSGSSILSSLLLSSPSGCPVTQPLSCHCHSLHPTPGFTCHIAIGCAH